MCELEAHSPRDKREFDFVEREYHVPPGPVVMYDPSAVRKRSKQGLTRTSRDTESPHE